MPRVIRITSLLSVLAVCALGAPAAHAATGAEPANPGSAVPAAPTGGAAFVPAPVDPVVDAPKAVLIDGVAHAPQGAPASVKKAIWAANQIIGKPYRYGGGHGRIADTGYDCSGTISFALNGAGLLKTPLDSSSFMSWGRRGRGTWITVYTNPGHAFAVIAGLRLDTSAANDPSGLKGPRWRPALRSTRGFRARHPKGL